MKNILGMRWKGTVDRSFAFRNPSQIFRERLEEAPERSFTTNQARIFLSIPISCQQVNHTHTAQGNVRWQHLGTCSLSKLPASKCLRSRLAQASADAVTVHPGFCQNTTLKSCRICVCPLFDKLPGLLKRAVLFSLPLC